MKRNLLLLAVMILTVFAFSSPYAQCPQQPNDNGVCDTLSLQVWPADANFPLPTGYAKISLYVSHDQPNPVDSIAAFVLPLCYTHSNPTKFCSLTAFQNQVLWGAAQRPRSVFRHLPDNTIMTVHNWMMDLFDAGQGEEWNFANVDLDGTSHFWLTLIPTGSEDMRYGDLSKRLIATMSFKLQDSMMVCLDTCFNPPSSRVAFSRADAVTYIPRLGWQTDGVGQFCHDFFIIPHLSPQLTCPGTQTQHTNGSFSDVGSIIVFDQATISSATATFLGGGVTGVVMATGTPIGDTIPFTVSYDVVNHCAAGGSVEVIVTDSQGAKDTCYFGINLSNGAPVITCPGNATVTSAAGFAGVATATDPDGDALTFALVAGPTGLTVNAAGNIAWDTDCEAVGGPYTVTVSATDVCQASAECSFTITVTNAAPVITCPPAFSAFAPFDYSGLATATDPELGALTFSLVSGPVGLTVAANGAISWHAVNADSGAHEVCVMVTDACGLEATCCFTITVKVAQGIMNHVWIGETPCVDPGSLVDVPILMGNFVTPGDQCFGGFELEVEFDYTSMTFVGADRGSLLTQLDSVLNDQGQWIHQSWEYFNYRMLPCPLCACCKYKILLLGMKDIPNGSLNQGLEICPIDPQATLVVLHFVVNNDEKLRGMMIPVCFEWEGTVVGGIVTQDWDCAENTFSDPTGNYLYVSNLNCEYMPGLCDPPGMNNIYRLINFQYGICGQNCGGVQVCASGPSECKRGDINYNTLPYEVADAVLFASYFAEGLNVFSADANQRAYQICATDVNADGRTLTLSDLVYLIRVILHDAVEIPKLAPSSVANVIVSNGIITTEGANIGAILFEFDSAVNPTLLSTNMEMINKDTKVLVWSRNGNSIETAAEVISYSGDAKLVSVTAVDRDSRTLTTAITAKVAPTTFALHPAYPNPFNPNTNLSFTLPEATNYSMKIYNVAGQLVRTYEGSGVSGLNVITWNGQDNAGNSVSSGVYFFKLIAGQYSATEKMVMMK